MNAAELSAHVSEIEPYEISLLAPRELPYHLHLHRLQRPNPGPFFATASITAKILDALKIPPTKITTQTAEFVLDLKQSLEVQ